MVIFWVIRLMPLGARQDDVMKMPLYPTEELIWDPNLVPEEHYSGADLI
jgi:hypothetical protein